MLVAQVSNLPYRRFPIGTALDGPGARERFNASQVGNLRYGRLEIYATGKPNEHLCLRNKYGLPPRR